jgi:hypothetical protein
MTKLGKREIEMRVQRIMGAVFEQTKGLSALQMVIIKDSALQHLADQINRQCETNRITTIHKRGRR